MLTAFAVALAGAGVKYWASPVKGRETKKKGEGEKKEKGVK